MFRSPEMLYQQRLGNAGEVGDTLQDKLVLTLLAEFIISVPDHFSLFANGALFRHAIYYYLKGEDITLPCYEQMWQWGEKKCVTMLSSISTGNSKNTPS